MLGDHGAVPGLRALHTSGSSTSNQTGVPGGHALGGQRLEVALAARRPTLSGSPLLLSAVFT